MSESPVGSDRFDSLVQLAARALLRMYLPEKHLFSHSSVLVGNRVLPVGVSLRYSAIALIGLALKGLRGIHGSHTTSHVLDRIAQDAAWAKNVGDAALTIWAAAEMGSRIADRLVGEISNGPSIVRFLRNEEVDTSQIAWALSALSRYYAKVEQSKQVEWAAVTVTKTLLSNQNPDTGLFSYSISRRGHGFFCDQVYPILALSLYAKTFDDGRVSEKALRCAKTLCSCQGRLGQWWWIYDPTRAVVLDHYPVFTVHQDAMLPLALNELSKVTGRDFSEYILSGLEWLWGRNEMQFPMIDSAHDIIWRGIGRGRGIMGIPIDILSNMVSSRALPFPKAFRARTVIRECRPYCLGWILAASEGFDV